MARNFSVLKNKGFTLIELMVVVSIVVIFSMLATIGWRKSQNNLALERSSVKLTQDIRKALDLSLSGTWFQCASGKISGYGIYFATVAPNSYLIFADCNGNNTYDAGDGAVQTISLESGVVISQISKDPLSIMFLPPNPAVFFNNGQSPGSQETITVSAVGSSETKTISINSNGVASIQ